MGIGTRRFRFEAVQIIAIDPARRWMRRAARKQAARLTIGCHRRAMQGLAAEALISRGQGQSTQKSHPEKTPRLGPRGLTRRARQTVRRMAQHRLADARPLHPAKCFAALRPYVESDRKRADLRRRRCRRAMGASMCRCTDGLINGVTGSIRLVAVVALAAANDRKPRAGCSQVCGDRHIGFHIAEIRDRRRGAALPFVAVARQRARLERRRSEIQPPRIRRQPDARLQSSWPARYYQVVAGVRRSWAVSTVRPTPPAPARRDRAGTRQRNGGARCINIMIESIAAPSIRLESLTNS